MIDKSHNQNDKMFYNIPGFSNYSITITGVVKNKQTGRILEGSINKAGYCHYRLMTDAGFTFTIGRHRLLCIVFKKDSYKQGLIVNHVNGVKGDDRLENLEWVTYRQNLEHAGKLHLTTKCKPIEVLDTTSFLIYEYPSAVSCSIAVGLSRDAVLYRASSNGSRVFPDEKRYRFKVAEPWPDTNVSKFGRANYIDVRYLKSKKVIRYESQNEAAIALNVVPSVITTWLNAKDQPVFPGFIQIKYSSDTTEWRVPGDLILELSKTTNTKPVVVINKSKSDYTIFESASACARSKDILLTTLSNRLNSNGNTVFKDGCRYMYYEKYVQFNGPFSQ